MPHTKKGQKVKRAMNKTYGAKKGKQVFYATMNKMMKKGKNPHWEGRKIVKKGKKYGKN